MANGEKHGWRLKTHQTKPPPRIKATTMIIEKRSMPTVLVSLLNTRSSESSSSSSSSVSSVSSCSSVCGRRRKAAGHGG